MNIYLKKRKKLVFNNYKTVREAISLNNTKSQTATEATNWEHHWIEQLTEMSAGHSPVNQTVLKQNKLTIKWWEN